MAPDYRLHFGGNPPMSGGEATGLMSGFRAAFPDFRDEVAELIAEGSELVRALAPLQGWAARWEGPGGQRG